MLDSSGHIIAIGGGGFGRSPKNPIIEDYIVNLSSMLSVANKPIIYLENFIYFMFQLLDKYNINLK